MSQSPKRPESFGVVVFFWLTAHSSQLIAIWQMCSPNTAAPDALTAESKFHDLSRGFLVSGEAKGALHV